MLEMSQVEYAVLSSLADGEKHPCAPHIEDQIQVLARVLKNMYLDALNEQEHQQEQAEYE